MSNHDRAACLLKNGHVQAAIAEERLDRRKKSEGFYSGQHREIVLPPLASITYVLHKEGISLNDIDLLVCGRSIKMCKNELLKYVPIDPKKVIEIPLPGHHLSHAYSAYGTCPFDETAVLVIDEQGHHTNEQSFEKCTWFEGRSDKLTKIKSFFGTKNDLSLGMFYDAFAALTGLSEAGKPSAGKLMGLAPFGKERPDWPELISCKDGNTFISLERLDDFFGHILPVRNGMENINVQHLDDLLLKYIPVSWDTTLAQDLAYKAQKELEKAVLHIAAELYKHTTAQTLSYAGGVALNCTTNAKLKQVGWRDVYIHPAATDDGAAVGLAMYGWIEILNQRRKPIPRFYPFTGIKYKESEIQDALKKYDLEVYVQSVKPEEKGAEILASGKVVCWFQGESEWGPRALGARSILADPTLPGIKQKINKIKLREPFRPFGISGTPDGIDELIDISETPDSLSPYMLSLGIIKDDRLKEMKHVDGTIRYQTVYKDIQPVYYNLIENFGAIKGVYAILNTSFNVMGEPLVESPEDAVRQFLLSGADVLIIENHMIELARVPEDVISKCVEQAKMETPHDPLQVALSMEAAGYPEEALRFFIDSGEKQSRNIFQGSNQLRQYHAFMMRQAIRLNDQKQAKYHAIQILKYSAFPTETGQAAQWMSKSLDDDLQLVGQVIGHIAPSGAAFRYFQSILVKHE